MVTGWAVEVEHGAQLHRVRRRLMVLLTAAVVVPCLLVSSLLVAAEKRNSERLRLHGVALTGRTWYLTSVTRLGRTWVPQVESTLNFPSNYSAVTGDGASLYNWSVHFVNGTLRASHHGEYEAAGGGPISYEIGEAVETVFKGDTALSLVGPTLTVAGRRGTLRYATVAPPLAPTSTITVRVEQQTASGASQAVPAALTYRDADGLELGQPQVSAEGTSLTDLAAGNYTITATVNGATCSPATVSVTSGQTVTAAVLCHP